LTDSTPELILLCGGRGVRLRPLTDLVPKALVPVRGRPIIDYIVDFFAGQGVEKMTFCTGYQGQKIRDHFSERSDLSLTFSDLGEDASMLQRIYAASKSVANGSGDGRFLVAYCDTFLNLDLNAFLDQHQSSDMLASIVTGKFKSPFGLVEIGEGDTVAGFREKPQYDYYIGTSVFEQRAMELVGPDLLEMPDGTGLVSLISRMIEQRKLGAYQHTGLNVTFNTHSEWVEAEGELARFYTQQEPDAGN
jgi:glucose-1-phosphate cytidylyltransferase